MPINTSSNQVFLSPIKTVLVAQSGHRETKDAFGRFQFYIILHV